MEPGIVVDDEGIHLPPQVRGTLEVLFDGEHVWTAHAPADGDAPRGGEPAGDDEQPGTGSPLTVAWPPNLRPWLDGRSSLRLRAGDEVHEIGEVAFGTSDRRIRFVDDNGVRIVVDKWGIRQRPFDGRDRRVVDHMVEVARTIVEVVERDVGVRLWMAFGTLLGAVREGGVIAHDADIDLAYLSDRGSPAAMMGELYAIRRALVAEGLRVINKTGSFLTVTFTAPDGSLASIDIYTCFHLGDFLYETATVRERVPREAIEPLQEMEFEHALLPAPADPDRMLAASYGPSWRTPDPSFQHRPSPAVVHRFDGWFGSVMRQRRDWEVYWRDTAPREDRGGSATARRFAEWMSEAGAGPERVSVVDLGCGDGRDALHLAREGWQVTGLDYARGSTKRAAKAARQESLPADFGMLNLYDLRDCLTGAALLRRRLPAMPCLYTRSLVDAVAPDARDGLWRFMQMLLDGGGKAFLEFHETAASAPPPTRPRFHGTAGFLFPVDPDLVTRQLREHGGLVVHRESEPRRRDDDLGVDTRRWRMLVEWAA